MESTNFVNVTIGVQIVSGIENMQLAHAYMFHI